MRAHAVGPGRTMVENGDCWVIAGAIFEPQNPHKKTLNQYDA